MLWCAVVLFGLSEGLKLPEHDLVPGLGAPLRGAPGTSEFSGETTPQPEMGTWEGATAISPEWNKDFLQRRNRAMAQQAREELTATIRLQRKAIEDQKLREDYERQEYEEISKKLGEHVVTDVANVESEVYDGYKATSEPQKAGDCEDDYDSMSPMSIKNLPPPPQLVRIHDSGPASRPDKDALKPIVVADPFGLGEVKAMLQSQYVLDDIQRHEIRTEMKNFQHWSLSRDGAVGPTESPSQTITAVSSLPGNDVVGYAKKTATKILQRAFSSEETVPYQDSLDFTTAWGVMNSQGERRLAPDTEYAINYPPLSATTSASPSPSPLPREIYVPDHGEPAHETFDSEFVPQVSLSDAALMPKSLTVDTDPSIEVPQPNGVDRGYVGSMPHSKSINVPATSTGLTGMGNDPSPTQIYTPQ